jgi:hypothetical protein
MLQCYLYLHMDPKFDYNKKKRKQELKLQKSNFREVEQAIK